MLGRNRDAHCSRGIQLQGCLQARAPVVKHPLRIKMIPVGYMAKRVNEETDWLKTDRVEDIYSVSSCISINFDDYIHYWQHNGYWLFNSPEIIRRLANDNNIDLSGTTMFYYEAYEQEYDENLKKWRVYLPESSFITHVIEPKYKKLEGFDIVSFFAGTSPECSYLSCNSMADEIAVNRHCLIDNFDHAKALIEQGVFTCCEPGPCRIFAVHSIDKT